MSLDILSQSANSRIKVNSFYDVFKEYSDEELKRYKRFSGISAESKYQEILDELEKEDAEWLHLLIFWGALTNERLSVKFL